MLGFLSAAEVGKAEIVMAQTTTTPPIPQITCFTFRLPFDPMFCSLLFEAIGFASKNRCNSPLAAR